jgi:hypothetical protein
MNRFQILRRCKGFVGGIADDSLFCDLPNLQKKPTPQQSGMSSSRSGIPKEWFATGEPSCLSSPATVVILMTSLQCSCKASVARTGPKGFQILLEQAEAN